MKILALSGSPRENGNTDQYLNMVLDECNAMGAETELIRVFDLSIKGCYGCYGCVQAKNVSIRTIFKTLQNESCTQPQS